MTLQPPRGLPDRLAPPDLPAATGLALSLGLLTAALVLTNGSALLNDPDSFWHIAAGREIVATRGFPTHDRMSHSFAGQPWMAKEWLSQVLLHAAYSLGGWTGTALLAAGAIAATAAMLAGRFGRFMGPTASALVAGLAVALMAGTMLARPHILAMPVFAAWTIGLMGRAERGEGPPWALLPLITLWTNLHASFALGLVLAAGCAGIALWEAEAEARKGLATRWGLFLAAATAGTLVTPYGAAVATLPFRMMGTGNGTEFIAEWRPLEAKGLGLVAMIAAAGIFAALARAPLRNLPRLLIVLFVTYQMLRHARFAMLFAVVAPVVAAEQIADALAWLRKRTGLFAGADPLAGPAFWGMRAAALATLLPVVLLLRPVEPAERHRPAAALASIGAQAQTGRVYNSYDFGGFLIERGVRTFVDGRTDQLFQNGFRNRIEEALDAPDAVAFGRLLAEHGVDWALVQTGSRDAGKLSRLPGWQQGHADPVATVFVRRE